MKIPDIKEVQAFIDKENLRHVDAEVFWYHYDAIDWVVGKNKTPMKKWRSAVKGWEARSKKKSNVNPYGL